MVQVFACTTELQSSLVRRRHSSLEFTVEDMELFLLLVQQLGG